MSKQMKYSCPNCDSENIAIEKRPDGWCHCLDCHYSWQPHPVGFELEVPKSKMTVFQSITASEETLARSLCGTVRVGCFYGYYSMLTGQHYPNMEEAIASTVKKLNEVKE